MPQDFSKYADYLNLLAPAEPNSELVPQTFDPAHPESFAKYLDVLKPQPQTLQPSPERAIASTPPVVRQPAPLPPPVAPVEPPKEDAPAPSLLPGAGAPLDFTGSSASSNQNLADVLKAQNTMNLMANLGRSTDKIGAAISRSPEEENSVYKSIEAQAAQLPAQYKQVQENEKNDPNSQISTGFRDFVEKRLGTLLKGNPSASDLSAVIPMLFKDFEARLAEKGKLEAKKLDISNKAEEKKKDRDLRREIQSGVQDNRDIRISEREDQLNTRRGDELNKRLTAETASSRSSFGKAATNFQAVQNAKALLEGNLDYNDLDTREVYEVAKTLDRILSQGQPTIAGASKLTPETSKSWLSKKMEFVTNQRQGAGLGDFIKRYEKTLNREENVAKNQMVTTQKKILGAYMDLYKKDPERFNNILRAHKLPTMEEMASNAEEVAPQATGKMIRIRRKSDGVVKELSEDKAKKFLSNPDFEQVQ